ncbi:MAG: Sec-independent protein translocase protein TatB [Thiovulaceae bacterium]|nr:Sec-independent protein translocase protein TatB [Sulfurimonadaceae bacterium]
MFGMDFGELLLIAIVAIIFLGPDKLPETMVQMAKMFKKVKSAISTAKDSIESELHLSDLKSEALAYKDELMKASDEIKSVNPITNIQKELYEVTVEKQLPKQPQEASQNTPELPKAEEITFTKKVTKPKEENI